MHIELKGNEIALKRDESVGENHRRSILSFGLLSKYKLDTSYFKFYTVSPVIL